MNSSKQKICVFGLGEAGGLIGRDLAMLDMIVTAYDPKSVPTPAAIERFDDPVDAVAGVDVVIALTASADAETALRQAFEQIPSSALYADFSTASSQLKQSLATRCGERNIAFADVAIMSIVPGHGVKAPTLVSGSGASRFVEIFSGFGMPTSVVSEQAGDAAARKLVRSVMMKGLAAVVIEAMQAADAAGCSDWLWQNLSAEITRADGKTLARLVRGTHAHGLRRLHEMQASTELLESLDVDPIMTRSTTENLRQVLANWPDPQGDLQADSRKFPDWWAQI